MLSQEELKSLVHYEPKTGVFTRLTCRRGDKVGKQAGFISSYSGYVMVSLNNKIYRAHRLAWLYIYGRWPTEFIDHINRVRHDNRIENLRECNKSQNMCNMDTPKHNTTGVKGVYWYKAYKKWVVNVKHNKKMHFIGYFSDFNAAKNAAWEARRKIHGEFASP